MRGERLRAGLGRARRAPRAMALVLATMAGAASLIGILTLAFLRSPVSHRDAQWVLTLSGLPFSALVLALGTRRGRVVPVWAVHVWLMSSVVLIGLGSWSAGGAPTSIASMGFFVWIGLYVGHFFSRRAVLWHLGWIAACLAALLAVDGGASSVGIMIFGIVALATAASRYLSELLRRVARTDALTGLPNRQALGELLSREVARAARQGSGMCVAIVDVDHFKEINDRHGHLAGDATLVEVARLWRARLRGGDILARYGGDEFVLILPGCALSDGVELLLGLRGDGQVACSAGVASWSPGDTVDQLLARADRALYDAKEQGRDRVVASPEGLQLPLGLDSGEGWAEGPAA